MITGMAARGSVKHVVKGVGTFGMLVSLCGRWIIPGECDLRLCKTCKRVGKITETIPLNNAEEMIMGCQCERAVHITPELYTAHRINGKKFTAFELSMFRDVLDDFANGAENDACWIGTLMILTDAPELIADGPKASERTRKGGNGGGNVIDPKNAKPARTLFGGSEKQRDLILSLVRQIDELNAEIYPGVKPLAEGYTPAFIDELNTQAKVRKDIDELFSLLNIIKGKAKAKRAEANKVENKPENGWVKGSVYVIDGVFHRVHISQSSGRPYTQAWNSLTEEWEYQGMRALKNCTPENKITAEQAAQWGHEHDWCVFCSRPLDDQRSREAGYGSRCADKHGLPWG